MTLISETKACSTKKIGFGKETPKGPNFSSQDIKFSSRLGGFLGTLAVLSKNEILLVVIGGVFVVEAVSVIMQVASFKLTGKRIFKMAPIHHHFELKGVDEPKVIVRFWIVAILLAIISLSTLKLR